MSESKVYTLSDVRINKSVKTKTEDIRIKGFALTDKPTVSKSGKIRVYKPNKDLKDVKSKIEDRVLDEDKLKALIETIKNSKAKVFTFAYEGADRKQKPYLTATSKNEAIDILLSGLAEGYAQATNPSNHLKIISDVQKELSEGVGGAGGPAEEGATGDEPEATGDEPEATGGAGGGAEEEKGKEPPTEPPTEADIGAASAVEPPSPTPPSPTVTPAVPPPVPPPVPTGAPPAPAGTLTQQQAIEQLKTNPQADVNVALIGPDTGLEQKKAGLIYPDSFSLVFNDRSGIRELEIFGESKEGKEAERKDNAMLFKEADEIREAYKDQLKIASLLFTSADEKKVVLEQWKELNTLKKGAIQNLTKGKASNPLSEFDSIGVVVDISSLGMSLQQFINYAQSAGLSASSNATKGDSRLTGLKKPMDLSNIAPVSNEDKPKEEQEEIEPQSVEKATRDKKKLFSVMGAPEYIVNEKVDGPFKVGGFRKPKKTGERRIRLTL